MGSLAAANARSSDGDAVFRRAMLDGTAVASFCPEGFSVEGPMRSNEATYQKRLAELRAMMVP